MSKSFKMDLPVGARDVLQILNTAGHKAYVVGGCVRDSLLGRIPKDFDICTSARPEVVDELFSSRGYTVFPTGIKHGTVTVDMPDGNYEVTTFRVDGYYEDGRHPSSVTFVDDLKEDLSRRDFTINAMAWSPDEGLVDPFGGRFDLQAGVVRCVGNPRDRFDEDGLRILRAIRFAATYQFRVHEDTRRAITSYPNIWDTGAISVERVTSELSKILVSPTPGKYLHEFYGLFRSVIPEMSGMLGCAQSDRHRHDVWEHTLTVLDTVRPTLELRLAALLHDIGKCNALTVDDRGEHHFPDHASIGANMAREILKRLRFPTKIVNRVSALVDAHDDLWLEQGVPVAYVCYAATARQTLVKYGGLSLSLLHLTLADVSDRNPSDFIYNQVCYLTRLTDAVLDLLRSGGFGLKDLAVTGTDLLNVGVPDGPMVGQVLKDLLDMVVVSIELNDKDTLLGIVRKMLAEGKV